jgi:copper transport protein
MDNWTEKKVLFLSFTNRFGRELNKVCFVGLLVISIVFILSFPFSAHAHSALKNAKPLENEVLESSPSKVELWFEDPVVIHSDSLKVINGKGIEFQKGDPQVDPQDPGHISTALKELSAGQYTVKINVITPDGYVFTDSYRFMVKKASVNPDENQPEFKLEKVSPGDGEIVKAPQKMDLWYTHPAEVVSLGIFNHTGESIRFKEPYTDPDDPRHLIVEFMEDASPGTYQVTLYASPKDKSINKIQLDNVNVFYFAVDEVTSLVPAEGGTSNLGFGSIGAKQVAHWLSFLGLLTLFGGTLFHLIIAKGRGNEERWRRVSLGLYALAVIGFFVLLIYRRFELPTLPLQELLALKFTWVPMLQILVLSLGFWAARGNFRLLFLGIAILLWSFVTGHSTYPRYGEGWLMGVNGLHLLSVSVWLGGLVALVVMRPKENSLAWFKEVGLAYSKWAFWSMMVIIGTGVWMSYQFVPSFTLGSLMISDWGKSLLGKVVLVTAILVFGFLQRRTFRRISDGGIQPFLRRARTEWIYAALILFAAALLIESTPSAAEQGVYPNRMVQDKIELSVEISPFRVGVNDITLRFKNQPEFERVRVKFSMPPLLWRVENNAFYLGDGTYRLSGGFIHAARTMKMEVEAIKPSGEKVVFPFQIVVPGEIRLDES